MELAKADMHVGTTVGEGASQGEKAGRRRREEGRYQVPVGENWK